MAGVQRVKAPVFEMEPKLDKIVEAILCVVNLGKDRGIRLTQYSIVKTLFLADRQHLNKYGRPITFDNYVAMQHGPVPNKAYNILKENGRVMKELGQRQLPWTRVAAPDISEKCYEYHQPVRAASEDILSESDLEELSVALTVVNALGFQQIRKLTHEDPAYIDAWEDDSEKNQFPMSYALLFETPNEDKAKDLSFLSRHQ